MANKRAFHWSTERLSVGNTNDQTPQLGCSMVFIEPSTSYRSMVLTNKARGEGEWRELSGGSIGDNQLLSKTSQMSAAPTQAFHSTTSECELPPSCTRCPISCTINTRKRKQSRDKTAEVIYEQQPPGRCQLSPTVASVAPTKLSKAPLPTL